VKDPSFEEAVKGLPVVLVLQSAGGLGPREVARWTSYWKPGIP
jgi:hypothetical protein